MIVYMSCQKKNTFLSDMFSQCVCFPVKDETSFVLFCFFFLLFLHKLNLVTAQVLDSWCELLNSCFFSVISNLQFYSSLCLRLTITSGSLQEALHSLLTIPLCLQLDFSGASQSRRTELLNRLWHKRLLEPLKVHRVFFTEQYWESMCTLKRIVVLSGNSPELCVKLWQMETFFFLSLQTSPRPFEGSLSSVSAAADGFKPTVLGPCYPYC